MNQERDAEHPKDERARDTPLAGPHARPELIDEDKTPGSGIFPGKPKDSDGNMPPTG